MGTMNSSPFKSMKVVMTLIVIVLLMVPYIPNFSADISFSTNVKVNSGASANRVGPDITVDSSGNAYCVWGDWRNSNWDIYFSKSLDGGVSWETPDVMVSSGSGNQTYPSITVGSSGNIYVVWEDDRNGDKDIYFAKSLDGGLSWSNPNIRVNFDTFGRGDPNMSQVSAQIAVDSVEDIYVIWQDNRWTDEDIFFAKSSDGGATWGVENTRVNTDSAPSPDQKNPTMILDSTGTIYVAWSQGSGSTNDIYFSKSTDGGTIWSNPFIRVNTEPATADRANPTIGVDSNANVFIAWQDNKNGNYDIYFASSFNGGSTWSNPNVRVDNSTSGLQYTPSIAVSESGTIYMTWQDSRNTDLDIYFAYSIDQGISWVESSSSVNDDNLGKVQRYPDVAVGSQGPIYVVWQDARSTVNEIFSATTEALNPFPFVDLLKVQGFLEGTPEIRHIIPNEPSLSFRFIDPNSDPMSQYNISVLNSDGSAVLWFCNITESMPSGSEKSVTYNTAPCPENGPQLLDGASYMMRVTALNSTGFWTSPSEIEFHLNEILAPQPPISPADHDLIQASENQVISWASPGVDGDGDTPVTYYWEVATDSVFSNVIEIGSGPTPESDAFDTRPSGIFYWRVYLSDGWETSSYANQPDGYWDFTTFTSSGSNSPPVITNKADAPSSAKVNGSISFTFQATDPDSDVLIWSKTSGAIWFSIDQETGTISGTPLIENLGLNTIEVRVSDGKGGIDNHEFTISVTVDGSNGDGDIKDDDNPEFPCWIILIIIIIILLILFFLVYKSRKENEDEEKNGKKDDKPEENQKEEVDEKLEEPQDDPKREHLEDQQEELPQKEPEDNVEGP
jgi:hypothetical protein